VRYILFLILLIAVSCSQAKIKRTDKLSILQGVTNTKEVEFSIVAQKSSPLRFELRSAEGDIVTPDETKVVSRDYSDYVVHKVVFIREQQKDFNLYVYEGDRIIDQRLIGKGQKEESKLRLAVASCMSDYYSKHFKIWDVLAAKNPEYLLMIGDNVYADEATATTTQATNPEILWQRYVDTRLSLPVFFNEKLIPVHALWDDHDFGGNDVNELYPYKLESKDIFEAFFAQDMSDDDWTKSFGVGGLLSLGDFNLYFLDARYFRSQFKEGSHLGLEQSAWFFSKVREEATPSLIIKGDQFFGGYHNYESFEGSHPESFNQFVGELRQINTPFVFVSGDRHMSEIMQFPRSLFGKPSFEVTSSPIHGKTFKNVDKNPWRVVEEKGNVNFTIIDNIAKDDHWFLDVESIGENGQVFYKRELAVFIKDLKNNLNEIRKRRSEKRRYKKNRTRRNRRR
jgi:alkaline phosphatase D